jgi:hydroxymethylpyrimidine pyrophosphatase-like HAD family hydrolase
MIIAFSDLDDTLFSSPRRFDSVEGLNIAATLPGGEVGAFASHAQNKMLEMISENCMLVPVTGRRTGSLSRVLCQFNRDKIASHGAIILDAENNIHPEWKRVLDAEVGLWSEKMAELHTAACEQIEAQGLDLRVRIVEDYGYPCYLCIKGNSDALHEINADNFGQLADGFVIHVNDRNLAFLPPYASKQRAVLFLKQLYQTEYKGEQMYLGLGDSISDLPFMSECHFQIIPSISQISEKIK